MCAGPHPIWECTRKRDIPETLTELPLCALWQPPHCKLQGLSKGPAHHMMRKRIKPQAPSRTAANFPALPKAVAQPAPVWAPKQAPKAPQAFQPIAGAPSAANVISDAIREQTAGEFQAELSAARVMALVRIAVPEVDRGRGDARNIIGVVLTKTVDELYQIGTKNGILKQLYTSVLLDADDVLSTEIALRSATNLQSTGTGQGFTKCICKKNCATARCLCFKNKVLCTSKCHSSLPCKNK
ncbi:hypothetical protein ACJJTC_018628 [Scirpophaga incertulas]